MGFVRKVGRAFDDAILQPITNTIEGIVSDPKKLAMVALSVMAPGAGTALGTAMGLSGTAATLVGQAAINTALNGGDVKSAIMAAALPVVGKEMAGMASSAFVDAGFDSALANSAGKVVSGAGLAAATGKDPLQALISGGLNEAIPNITKDIPGYADMPASVQSMINRTVASNLAASGGTPTQETIAAATLAGAQAGAQGMDQAASAAKPAPSAGSDVLLAALSGAQRPEMFAPADVKSFEQQGYGDLFGGDLFKPANSANTQPATAARGGSVDELLRILGA